jgi:hypothetical protein
MDRKRDCSVSHWCDHMRRPRKPGGFSLFTGPDASLLVFSRPTGKNGRELSQSVTRVANRYELLAGRFRRCEGVLRW